MEFTNTNENHQKSEMVLQTIHEDFSPKAQNRISKMGKKNKRSKEVGRGEFAIIFGNKNSDKSDVLKITRKLKYSYFYIALNTENVSVLEQRTEYLQLRPRKHADIFIKEKDELIKGNTKIECTECKYKCTKDITMLEHMVAHTGEYFLCEKCDAKYSDITDLRKHMINHTSYLPFACTECDFLCAELEEIQNHFASHENIKYNSY